MSDNVTPTGSGAPKFASREVSYSGETAQAPVSGLVAFAGSDDAKTAADIPGDATNGLDVDVTRVPTDPFGANADAASATGSISAKLRGIATAIGITAFDLGTGTAGSRTLRFFQDTAQWIGGAGAVTSAVQRMTLASDDPAVSAINNSALPLGAGTAAAAGRVTHASDDPAVVALQLIDDPVAVLGTATYTEATTKGVVIGAVRRDADTTLVDTTNEVAPLQVNAGGQLKTAVIAALPAGTNAIGKLAANSGVDIGDVDVTSLPADPFGLNADAASATGSISAKLRGMATALGVTALDLGSGTGGSRTLRFFRDTAQWIGGAGAVTSAVQRVTLASDDPAVTAITNATGPVGAGTAAAAQRTTLASDDPAVAALGTTSGAKVVTDASGTIQQYLRGIVTFLANALGAGTAATASRVTLASDDPGVSKLTTIAAPGLSASATFTPAASSHTAIDCNGAAGTFALGAVSAGRVMITDASLEIDGATAEATAWRLYLYNVTPPSAYADDAAWDLGSGDRASFLGYVDLGTAVDLGSTQWVQQSGLNRSIKLAGTSVYGYLVNLTTLTPAAVAHIVTLNAVQL
jgi:uncharacterized protein (DUF2141 family)